MEERNFYLLAYDIRDDKRRSKIARLMEAYGERVQYSVFEAYLTPLELDKVLKRVRKFLKMDEDSLRIYLLCQACRVKVQKLGCGQSAVPPSVKIV
jgi:CRISPR-associated protein Cas2